MEVATRVFEAVRRRRSDLLDSPKEWERYEQILRLASLLHDVGHAPFSHASDEVFPRDAESGKQFEHEDYTRAIILNSEFASIIDAQFSSLGITSEDITNVHGDDPAALGPVGVLLHSIVAGELDADRMDYLARDSLYAGVTYGRYDLDRLLDTITVVDDKDSNSYLAVDDDGLYALEAFLLARYYMFLQVYLHEDRRFYDLSLTRTIRHLLEDDGGTYPPPDRWQDFVKFDDVWLQWNLAQLAGQGHIWAECLLKRQHWKVVDSHVAGTLDQPDYDADSADWFQAQRALCEEYGEEIVIHDDAHGRSFQRTSQRPYISRAEKEERPKILVISRKTGEANVVEEASGLVRELSKQRIRIRRLYARPDKKDDVELRWNRVLRGHD